MTRCLIATSNPGKLREIRPHLAGLPIEWLTLADVPPCEPPEETGETFVANARLKARAYSSFTGLPAVAEDSGLEIDALGGAPGVRSARFGGAALTYPQRFTLIEESLREKPDDRTARFVCALALADGGRILFEASGVVEGTIAPEPRGEGGFGYDPIFFYPPFGCTLAEAGERKAIVSHRAQAFAKFREFVMCTVAPGLKLGPTYPSS
jgi:XTP/dITP diphosphohydrolase